MLEIEKGELGSGKIYIHCTLDKYQGRFFLDTGANYTTVVSKYFDIYPTIGKQTTRSASDVAIESDKILINSLTIGKKSVENFTAIRRDAKNAAENTLGIQAIASDPFSLLMDQASPSLNLAITMPNEKLHSLILYEKEVFSIPVSLGNNIKLEALFDTGAGLNSVDSEYARSHPKNFEFVKEISNGLDGTGRPVIMSLYKIKELRVGNRRFFDENVLAFDFKTIKTHINQELNMILGYNTIVKMDWFFDLKAKLWWSR